MKRGDRRVVLAGDRACGECADGDSHQGDQTARAGAADIAGCSSPRFVAVFAHGLTTPGASGVPCAVGLKRPGKSA